MQNIKIDRSRLSPRWLENFKAKHIFALVLEVGSSDLKRTAGLNAAGEPIWLYQSARRAHQQFGFYTPGHWYNYGLGEKVLSVTLVREDGKRWHKSFEEAAYQNACGPEGLLQFKPEAR